MAGSKTSIEGNGITRQQSSQLQGLAILLLIYHHFFNDLTIYGERLSFWNPDAVLRLAWFGKICVGTFAFITGYGMCKVLERRDATAIKTCGFQIFQFLIRYWAIFLLFLGCFFSLGKRAFELKEFLLNFFCLRSTYNGAFWYVQQYVMMLLFLALAEAFWRFGEAIWKKGDTGKPLGSDWKDAAERIAAVVLTTCGALFGIAAIFSSNVRILFQQFLDGIRIAFVLACFMGYFLARLNFFEWLFGKLYALNVVLRLILGLFMVILVGMVRIKLADSPAYATLDFVFVPVFLTGILLCLHGAKWIEAPLERLGKLSVYVWLTHLFVYDMTSTIVLDFVSSHLLFYLVEAVLCIFVGSTCTWAERGIREFPKRFKIKRK